MQARSKRGPKFPSRTIILNDRKTPLRMIEPAIDGMAAPPTTRLSRRKVSRSQLDAASCGFGALDFAEIVPAEIVAEIMSHMRGIDLAASAAVTSTWTILARATAEVLLRRRIPTLPRHSTCLNWVRAFKSSHPFTRSSGPTLTLTLTRCAHSHLLTHSSGRSARSLRTAGGTSGRSCAWPRRSWLARRVAAPRCSAPAAEARALARCSSTAAALVGWSRQAGRSCL